MTIAQSGRQILNAGIRIRIGDYGDASQTKGDPPTMIAIAAVDGKIKKEFVFPFRPLPLQLEGFGLELAEVERPYDVPIVNVKSGKLRRFSFDAPLSLYDDGISRNLEVQERVLRQMADDAIPVRFLQMPQAITAMNWYITELSLTTDRTTVAGAVVRVSASMSFTEFEAAKTKFIFLSPISYGVPTGAIPNRGDGVSTGPTFPPIDEVAGAAITRVGTEAGLDGRPAPPGNP